MAERKVKCQVCHEFDLKSKMTQEVTKKFYHIESCHSKYIEQVEYQEQENKKWSDLFEYIKELHGLLIVPPWNIKRLQNLRGGFDTKDGEKYKRYRIGVEFDLMLEAYKLQEEKIKWFIKDVLNDGKDASDINKCISMMLNGLNTAWQNRQIKLKQQEQLTKELTKSTDSDMSIEDVQPVKAKRRKDDGDISHLL